MIPAPTTSRSASAPRPADLGLEPVTRGADEELEHLPLRVLAAFGCGIASLPILLPLLYLAIAGPVFGAAVAAGLFFLVILVPGVPIALAWRWTNPGHYAVAYLMIWAPFTTLFALVMVDLPTFAPLAASWFLVLEYGLYSLGLPLCVVAWAEWVHVLRKRRVTRIRRGAYAGDWRVVAAGLLVYLGGFGLSSVACGGALLLLVGIALVIAGFLMRGPLPQRLPGAWSGIPVPPACPRCMAPLAWSSTEGRWACTGCGTRF